MDKFPTLSPDEINQHWEDFFKWEFRHLGFGRYLCHLYVPKGYRCYRLESCDILGVKTCLIRMISSPDYSIPVFRDETILDDEIPF